MTCLRFLQALHQLLTTVGSRRRTKLTDISKVSSFCQFSSFLLKRPKTRVISSDWLFPPPTSGDTIQTREAPHITAASFVQTKQRPRCIIHEDTNKHQINIHTDELIHKYMAIFIHNLHSNTFAGPDRSEREKYHYTIIRLPSTFHCPLPNMKYSMYLHLKMSIPFNITA